MGGGGGVKIQHIYFIYLVRRRGGGGGEVASGCEIVWKALCTGLPPFSMLSDSHVETVVETVPRVKDT